MPSECGTALLIVSGTIRLPQLHLHYAKVRVRFYIRGRPSTAIGLNWRHGMLALSQECQHGTYTIFGWARYQE
jgi:hypothetical protein